MAAPLETYGGTIGNVESISAVDARPKWLVKTGRKQRANFPGTQGTTCSEGIVSESAEPLVGRLGAPAQRGHLV